VFRRIVDHRSVEQESVSRLRNDDSWISSDHLWERFKRFGDLADLEQTITVLEELLRFRQPT